MNRLFTERHGRPEPRVKESLEPSVRTALFRLIETRIEDHSFGESFPAQCPDGRGNSGVNEGALHSAIDGYRLIWPGDVWKLAKEEITDGQIFDLVEFSYEHISEPA